MKLQDVLKGVPVLVLQGEASVEIEGIAYSSKAVRPKFLFAALKGARTDGFDFVAQALA